jgi:mRNA interferase YafQ
MREIKYTARFKRDYRREKSGRHGNKLDALLMEVVNLLADDTPLPRRNFDHPLSGEWNDHRDCHIRPDLVLIYRKPDDESLELVRLGSHSELGLGKMGRGPNLTLCDAREGSEITRGGHCRGTPWRAPTRG